MSILMDSFWFSIGAANKFSPYQKRSAINCFHALLLTKFSPTLCGVDSSSLKSSHISSFLSSPVVSGVFESRLYALRSRICFVSLNLGLQL